MPEEVTFYEAISLQGTEHVFKSKNVKEKPKNWAELFDCLGPHLFANRYRYLKYSTLSRNFDEEEQEQNGVSIYFYTRQ